MSYIVNVHAEKEMFFAFTTEDNAKLAARILSRCNVSAEIYNANNDLVMMFHTPSKVPEFVEYNFVNDTIYHYGTEKYCRELAELKANRHVINICEDLFATEEAMEWPD